MTTDLDAKTVFALRCLNFVPPLIQESLREDSDFRDEYGLTTDSVLSFGDTGLSIDRRELFDGIREVLAGNSNREVVDTIGRKWLMQTKLKKGDLPRLSILRHDLCFSLYEYFIALSPHTETRLRLLEKTASDVNLPESAVNRWRDILEKRPLEDVEVDGFQDDFDETPVRTIKVLREIFNQGGRVNLSSLVPHSRRYYERLVGTYDGSATIGEYATGSAREIIKQLTAWRPYDGFLIGLFLSSHLSLTDEINVDQLSSEELAKAYGFLERHGDRMSQLGAIEVGLRILSKRPDIEPTLTALIQGIRDEDVDGNASGFKLLSALFCLVDGELSRIRLFSEEPPFYRRLVALSQASLVHRQLVNSSADIDDFTNWALENCRGFYLQSLIDMRAEPRWDPDLVNPSQIKANFLGRIAIAARKNEANIRGRPIFRLLISDDAGSVQSLSDSFYTWLPSPLEGTETTEFTLPRDVANAIETQLNAKEVGISSFFALVNCARIYNISTDQAQLAADALKRANYWIQDIDNKQELVAILNGLATAAAVTRSSMLADELRVLVRKYRRDSKYRLSIPEDVKLCLSAAASRSGLTEWTGFVGEWLTELAFGDLKKEEAEMLRTFLDWLCQMAPELWVTCGRADAALRAYIAK